MKLFYGWVIVGVGIVVSCVGMGTMMSLGVFLQPMSQDDGLVARRHLHRRGAQLPLHGAGSFLWGSLSDRFGTRCGRADRRRAARAPALIAASQATTLLQFQLLFGVAGRTGGRRLLCADDRDGHALVHPEPQPRRGTGFGGPGDGLDCSSRRLARWLITAYDWRTAMLALGALAWLVILPAALLLRPPPARAHCRGGRRRRTATSPSAQALRTPQFAAIALTHFACCAAHSGPIFHMVSYAIDCGVPAMVAATVFGVAGLSALSGRIVCGLVADRVGAKRDAGGRAWPSRRVAVSLYLFSRDACELLRAGGAVRLLLWRRHAALRDPGARVFRRPRSWAPCSAPSP